MASASGEAEVRQAHSGEVHAKKLPSMGMSTAGLERALESVLDTRRHAEKFIDDPLNRLAVNRCDLQLGFFRVAQKIFVSESFDERGLQSGGTVGGNGSRQNVGFAELIGRAGAVAKQHALALIFGQVGDGWNITRWQIAQWLVGELRDHQPFAALKLVGTARFDGAPRIKETADLACVNR